MASSTSVGVRPSPDLILPGCLQDVIGRCAETCSVPTMTPLPRPQPPDPPVLCRLAGCHIPGVSVRFSLTVVLSLLGTLAKGPRPRGPCLREHPERASTGKGVTPAVTLHLSDDRAGKSLTTQGAGPAPQQAGGRARGTRARFPEPRRTRSVWRFPFSSGHFQTSIHRRVVRVNVLTRSSSSRASLLGAVSHSR